MFTIDQDKFKEVVRIFNNEADSKATDDVIKERHMKGTTITITIKCNGSWYDNQQAKVVDVIADAPAPYKVCTVDRGITLYLKADQIVGFTPAQYPSAFGMNADTIRVSPDTDKHGRPVTRIDYLTNGRVTTTRGAWFRQDLALKIAQLSARTHGLNLLDLTAAHDS